MWRAIFHDLGRANSVAVDDLNLKTPEKLMNSMKRIAKPAKIC
jgi:hypothetical protein